MSEQCIKCEKEIDGVYHCITCCVDLNNREELRHHMDDCSKAAFLNPLEDN